MNRDLENAKKSLLKNGYTCVLCAGDREYSSTLRGVKPLIEFLDSGESFSSFSAADKTVGAGAAHLYVLLGVKSVFASIISQEGKRILEENKIDVFYDAEVPYIINRARSGMCPIESAVLGVNNPTEALEKIRKVLKELSKKA